MQEIKEEVKQPPVADKQRWTGRNGVQEKTIKTVNTSESSAKWRSRKKSNVNIARYGETR